METTRPILVIGGGPAGTFAAIAAKKHNPDGRVVLLTEEPCEPYEKPPLSKGVLVGKVLPADAPIAGPGPWHPSCYPAAPAPIGAPSRGDRSCDA